MAGDRHVQDASPIAEFPLRVNRNICLIINIIPIKTKSNLYPGGEKRTGDLDLPPAMKRYAGEFSAPHHKRRRFVAIY